MVDSYRDRVGGDHRRDQIGDVDVVVGEGMGIMKDDLIEKMCKADTMARIGAELPGDYSDGGVASIHIGMTAAAQKLMDEVCATIDRFQDIYGWQLGESRNALVKEISDRVRSLIESPKTLEERVTVTDVKWGDPGWLVCVDGKVRLPLADKEDAEIYRLGLIAKMGKEEK